MLNDRFEDEWNDVLTDMERKQFIHQVKTLKEILKLAKSQKYISFPEVEDTIKYFMKHKVPLKSVVFDRLLADWTRGKYFNFLLFYKENNYVTG